DNRQRRRLKTTVLSLPTASSFLIIQISVTIEATIAERRNVNLRTESDSRNRPHTETVDSSIRTIPQAMRRINKIAATPSIKKLLPQLTKGLIEHQPIGLVEMQHLLRVLREQAVSCVHTRRQQSEEHTSELQSRENLVCRLLLEKKKNT